MTKAEGLRDIETVCLRLFGGISGLTIKKAEGVLLFSLIIMKTADLPQIRLPPTAFSLGPRPV